MATYSLTSLTLQEQLGGKEFNEFCSLATNKDRVNFFLCQSNNIFTSLKEGVNSTAKPSVKSVDQAVLFKKEGNTLFQAQKYVSAIEKYNRGIFMAPHFEPVQGKPDFIRNPEFGILIANRSACLFHSGQFSAALCDVHCALHLGYPSSLKYKLFDRSAKCLLQLQRDIEANNQFKAALEALETANLKPQLKLKWTSILKKHMQDLADKQSCTRSLGSSSKKMNALQKLHDKCSKLAENALPENLSDAVTIKSSPEFGRYVAATKPLNPGRIIATEAPFVSILLPQFYSSHCFSCLCHIEVPFPCRQCNVVQYCSYQCEETAWTGTHKYECPFMDFFKPEICARMGHIALRMFFRAWRSITSISPLSTAGDYSKVHGLVHHEKSRDSATNLHMTLIAFLLTEIVSASDFLEDTKVEGEVCKDKQVIGELILKHLQIVQCNGYVIPEMQDAQSLKHSKPLDIGLAVYPVCSYFNHSCDPSVEFCFKGDQIIVYTLKGIAEGEQVYSDYGLVFYSNPKEQRQNELSLQYLFRCSCVPCIEDWPLFDDLNSKIPIFKCSKCSGPMWNIDAKTAICKSETCKAYIDISMSLNQLAASHSEYKDAMHLALAGSHQEALPVILKHMSNLEKFLCQPWKEYYSCHASVKQIIRLMGNTAK